VTAKNKKIKTLVCILGQTRAQDITWINFNNYVLKSLNADLALCVAEKKTLNNQMYKNAKFIWKHKDLNNFSKHFDDIQKKLIRSKNLDYKPNWKKLFKMKNFWHYTISDMRRIKGSSFIRFGTGTLLIFNRWFLLQKIMKLGLIKKYDRFIITRSDFFWNIHHPTMRNLDPSYIWIPNGEKYGGYTDRHAVLSRTNIYDYLNLLEPILLEPKKLFDLMKSKKNWNLEKYIKFYLNKKGYSKKVKFFPYVMFSVRNKLIKTGFRPGSFSHKHKFFIKYFKEYLSSMIMYFVIGNKNKNYNNFNFLYVIYKLFKNLFKIRLFLYIFFKNKNISQKFDKKFIKDNLEKKIIL
jgi:hypothetical protein